MSLIRTPIGGGFFRVPEVRVTEVTGPGRSVYYRNDYISGDSIPSGREVHEAYERLTADFDGDVMYTYSTAGLSRPITSSSVDYSLLKVKLRAKEHITVKSKFVKEGCLIYLDISLVLTNGQVIQQQRVVIDQSKFEKNEE